MNKKVINYLMRIATCLLIIGAIVLTLFADIYKIKGIKKKVLSEKGKEFETVLDDAKTILKNETISSILNEFLADTDIDLSKSNVNKFVSKTKKVIRDYTDKGISTMDLLDTVFYVTYASDLLKDFSDISESEWKTVNGLTRMYDTFVSGSSDIGISDIISGLQSMTESYDEYGSKAKLVIIFPIFLGIWILMGLMSVILTVMKKGNATTVIFFVLSLLLLVAQIGLTIVLKEAVYSIELEEFEDVKVGLTAVPYIAALMSLAALVLKVASKEKKAVAQQTA